MPTKSFHSKKTKRYALNKIRSRFAEANLGKTDYIVSLTKRKKLPPISKWRFIEDNSGGRVFSIGKGKKIIVKPEILVQFSNAKIAAKPNNNGRYMLELITELMRRRVKIEVPLGEITTKSGRKFYITEFIKKNPKIKNLAVLLMEGKKREVQNALQQMAKTLAQVHSKGVIHGHPRADNWVVTEKGTKLIDVKGIKFKEEFPWITNIGNVYTFDQMRKNDVEYLFREIEELGPLKEFFVKEYEKYYKK